jgi:uncharacterized protein (DUF736 family)
MDMTKLTGVWKNTDKNGNTYLSGSLSPITNLMIMPNTFKKTGDKAPDYFVYIAPREKKEEKIDNGINPFNL